MIEPADATELAFSPDGSLLAGSSCCIGCSAQAVHVWRVSGRCSARSRASSRADSPGT
jgi:hypothetical protein